MAERSDLLPDKICCDCKQSVQQAFEFKKKIETSYNILTKRINSVASDTDYSTDQKKEDTADQTTQTDQTSIYCCEQCDEKFLDSAMLKVMFLQSISYSLIFVNGSF